MLLGRFGHKLRFARNPIRFLLDGYRTYGPLFAMAEGDPAEVFACAPEHNHLVLGNPDLFYAQDAKSLPVPAPEGSALAMLFTGLPQANGPRHRQQRRLIMPAFHKQRIDGYRDDIARLAAQRVESWRAGDTLDISAEMKQITLSVLFRCLLGLDLDQNTRRYHALAQEWQERVFSAPVMMLPFNIPGLPYHRAMAESAELVGEVGALIARKRAAGAAGADILSMLLQTHDEDGTALTDEELIGHAHTLFVAGHETTATAATWTLLLLALHPDVLADLQDELDGALHGEAPTVEQIGRLPLLDAAIKEAMRLLPPVTWWGRVAQAPVDLGPHRLPQGSVVMYSPLITHRLPELYPEPDRFLPGRWERISPSQWEYLPFAAGPRICLGATFAMTQLKIVLPAILQRWQPALEAGARVDLGWPALVLTGPKGGLPMRMLPRGSRASQPGAVAGSITELVSLAAGK